MAGGAAVNVLMKSGPNNFRGTGFEHHINSALKARNVTDQADLVAALSCVVDCAADDLAGGVVATHRVDRDAHRC